MTYARTSPSILEVFVVEVGTRAVDGLVATVHSVHETPAAAEVAMFGALRRDSGREFRVTRHFLYLQPGPFEVTSC